MRFNFLLMKVLLFLAICQSRIFGNIITGKKELNKISSYELSKI